MGSRFGFVKAGLPRRTRALALLTVLAAVMVPAAISWACNPQAYLRINPTTVPPGSQMNISGAFFKGNASLTLTIEGGASTGVTTSANGSFSTTMTAPSAVGSYAISAVGFESDGSVTNGLPARASFSVAAAGPSGQPGTTPQPGTSGSGTSRSPAAPPSGGRFAEPEVPGTRTFSTPGSRSGGRGDSSAGGGGGGTTSTGSVTAGAGVIDSSAGAVFAGSVARDERTPGSAGAGGGTPSERTAGSDIWAGFETAGAPSLAADAGESAPSGGAGSQFGWGLGLLALGLVSLVTGLGVSEARSRRRAAAG